MSITLNHTIVPARDKAEAARWFASTFGVPSDAANGHFAPVHVNDLLTFLFMNEDKVAPGHYAFLVSDAEFDAILNHVRSEGRAFGSGPFSLEDGQLNHRSEGRGVYFRSPDGHVLELMTTKQ